MSPQNAVPELDLKRAFLECYGGANFIRSVSGVQLLRSKSKLFWLSSLGTDVFGGSYVTSS